MAEAGGDGQPKTGRFFCHKCNEELSRVLEDFTCPKCKGGFVETLSDIAPPSGTSSASGISSSQTTNPFRDGLFPFLELSRGLAREVEVNVNDSPGHTSRMSFVIRPGGLEGILRPPPPGGSGGGSQNHGQDAQPINPMENMLFSFLNDLITGLSGGGGVTVGGGFPMLANIGDYVWGREGLDAIVTQLMNQMEGTGPPPMPSEQLDRIPTVKISEEQVNKKLQCSVCWDDFQLNEEVKQLGCEHVFHPDCIVPWLKLHGTCPICRKDLTDSNDASANPSRFEPPEQDNSSNDFIGGSRSQGGSGRSGRENNDLDRMDYDFD